MYPIIVGQRIKITAGVWAFCGTSQNALYVNEVPINAYAVRNPNTCLNVSGIGVTFKLVGTSGTAECANCSPQIVYSIIGVGITNSGGVVAMDHDVTASDISAYNDSVLRGISLKVIACITDPKGQAVIKSNCSDSITVFQIPQPTHYIKLSMGFVSPQLAGYFERYIVDISGQLLTKIAAPPAPWIYVKTTYDSANNAFLIWFYLQPVMSPDANTDLFNWGLAWVAFFVGAFLTVLGIVILATGGTAALLFGLGGLFYLAVGAVIVSITLFAVLNATKLLQNTATNLQQQLTIVDKENKGQVTIEQMWQQSAKTQADCLTRLQSKRDLHNLVAIDGTTNIFGKYANLATAVQSEKTSFTTAANTIITQFQAQTYSIDVCNTYFSNLEALINSSNVKLATLISQNVAPNEGYSPTCAGWSNQTDCETHECFWYNGGCHKDPACWIPNPVGGCILSAGTGTVIVGAIVLVAVGGVAYWLLTRYPKETRTIITGAKGAVVGQVEKARQAYSRIAPIPKPLPLPPALTQI
jgi:hypothetical protein